MRAWIALGVLCALAGTAGADGEWSDSGIKGPKYATILEQTEALAAQYPRLATVIDYGETVKGRTLRMLVVMKHDVSLGAGAERPTLLMSGSTHGNEYLNIEDRLPAELLKKSETAGEVRDFLNRGGAFVFVPILNPDGYDTRRRENAHGVDLNRDWDIEPIGFHGFKEVETKTLAAKLEELHGGENRLQYAITVDYHCCIGAALHPFGFTKDKMPDADLRRHQAVGELANQHLDIEVGATGEVLGYFPVGATKDYYYLKYGSVSFTFEGRRNIEKNNFPQHLAWWDSMLGWLQHQERPPLFRMSLKKPRFPFALFAD